MTVEIDGERVKTVGAGLVLVGEVSAATSVLCESTTDCFSTSKVTSILCATVLPVAMRRDNMHETPRRGAHITQINCGKTEVRQHSTKQRRKVVSYRNCLRDAGENLCP